MPDGFDLLGDAVAVEKPRRTPVRRWPAGEVKLRVLSLGAGVQSTTLALMAAHGEIGPMPDACIFADTGAEPAAVYEHLRWMMSGNVLPFPVHIVSAGNIREDLMRGTNSGGRKRFASIPYFLDQSTEGKRRGMGRRQCTKEYKIEPLGRKQRELLGYAPRSRIPVGACEVWIGISTDEAARMKPSQVGWQTNRWPLIEAGMSRRDCLAWLERNGYPTPPKSSCTFCPFRDDASWRRQRDTDAEGWAEAVAVDYGLRENKKALHLRAVPYLHRSLVPLDQVDLSTPVERGQGDMFINECSGHCGV